MKQFTILSGLFAALVLAALAGGATSTIAATTCTFTTSGTNYRLNANCTTDATIAVPSGLTLDGMGKTITVNDPVAGHFLGAAVRTAGPTGSVKNLNIVFAVSASVCETGGNMLVGILFEGTSGRIDGTTVTGARRPGCDEGDGIVVRNAPFDGMHPATKSVNIGHSTVRGSRRNGIAIRGDVASDIYFSKVASDLLSAPYNAGIVIADGATGLLRDNTVVFAAGGHWAILIDEANGVSVNRNKILGANVGIGIQAGCFRAPTANGNQLTNNDLQLNAYGIVIAPLAFAADSQCDSQANNNLVRYNKIFALSGIYGIYITTTDDNGAPQPNTQADANELRNNTITGYATPIVDLGTNTIIVP